MSTRIRRGKRAQRRQVNIRVQPVLYEALEFNRPAGAPLAAAGRPAIARGRAASTRRRPHDPRRYRRSRNRAPCSDRWCV